VVQLKFLLLMTNSAVYLRLELKLEVGLGTFNQCNNQGRFIQTGRPRRGGPGMGSEYILVIELGMDGYAFCT